MTWTYFSSYLDGTRFITKAERDEIYDNLTVLLASAECSSWGYSVDATKKTAVRDSNLLTDRLAINAPGGVQTFARLDSLLGDIGAFSNFTTARDSALLAEGITLTQKTTIFNSQLDHYKLWNYYKRLIDTLSCCRPPVVTNQSRSSCAGSSFSYNISATNSPTSYSASGLPSGLSVNTSTGAITGTPTNGDTETSVTISATNSCGTGSGTLTLKITGCGSSIVLSGYGENLSATPSTCVDESQSFSDQFTCAQDVDISFVVASTRTGQVVVKANGVTVYDSGCQYGEVTVDDTFTVPAGTTTLRVIGTCSCDAASGGSIAWGLSCG